MEKEKKGFGEFLQKGFLGLTLQKLFEYLIVGIFMFFVGFLAGRHNMVSKTLVDDNNQAIMVDANQTSENPQVSATETTAVEIPATPTIANKKEQLKPATSKKKEEPKKVATKKAKNDKVAKQKGYSFAIQVLATKSQADAKKVVAKLNKLKIANETISEGGFNKVRVKGFYKSEAEAKKSKAYNTLKKNRFEIYITQTK